MGEEERAMEAEEKAMEVKEVARVMAEKGMEEKVTMDKNSNSPRESDSTSTRFGTWNG